MLTYNEALKGIKKVFSYGFNTDFENFHDSITLDNMLFSTLDMVEFESFIKDEFNIEEDINACLRGESTLGDIAHAILILKNKTEENNNGIDIMKVISIVGCVFFVIIFLFIICLKYSGNIWHTVFLLLELIVANIKWV